MAKTLFYSQAVAFLFTLTLTSAPLAKEVLPLAVRDHVNGLRSATLSRPLRANTIVALQFDVGSFQDRSDIPGLAHLAEHLFLRQLIETEDGKWQSLRDFLKSRGGRLRAKTSHESTRYYFEINRDSAALLLQGLQRIITTANVDVHAIDSEIAAIEDEFAFLKTKQSWLLRDALKATTSEGHPFRRLSAGNRSSFSRHDAESLRAALTNFYQRYYHAANLTVLLVGPQSDPDLQAALGNTLANLPSRNLDQDPVAPLFDLAHLPRQIQIRAAVGRPQLNLLFPLNGVDKAQAREAMDYLDFWSESSEAGSWQQQLIDSGLVHSADLASGIAAGNAATLSIHLTPTDKGLEQLDSLLALSVQSLHALMAQSEGHPLYQHYRRPVSASIPSVIDSDLALSWLSQAAEKKDSDHDQDDSPYFFGDTFKSRLALENLLLVYLGDTLETNAKSPVFDVPYQLQPKLVTPPPNMPKLAQFTPPVKVSEMESLPALAETAAEPLLLLQTPSLVAWHSPHVDPADKILLRLSLDLPLLDSSVRNRSLSSVWFRALKIASANNPDVEWYQHTNGVGIELQGDASSLTESLRTISDHLRTALTAAEFEQVKSMLIHEWQQPPRYRFAFEALVDELKQTLIPDEDRPTEKISALQTLDVATLSQLQSSSLSTARATLYLYGATREQAEQISAQLHLPHQLETSAHAEQEPGLHPLSPGTPEALSAELGSNANALLRYQQAPTTLPQDYARLKVLLPMIKHQYFASLRERQNLAYGVTVVPVTLQNQQGLALIAQSSTTDPERLQDATETFLRDFPQWLNTIPAAQFEQLKAGALAELSTAALKGEQLATFYWTQITDKRENQQWRQSVIESLQALERQDISDYYQTVFDRETQRALILKGWPKREG